MKKLIRSRSSSAKGKTKDRPRERAKNTKESKSPTIHKPEVFPPLLDIGTIHEVYDDYMDFHEVSVLIYSTKFQSMRNRWFWESACNKGYFVSRTRARETILRPVLRLYNSVSDVTSDEISSHYDLKQPFLGVRSRRPTEPYCRFARQLWLQYKMPRRSPASCRLVGVTAVSIPPFPVGTDQLDALLSQALSSFRELHDLVTFPVLSGLGRHYRYVTDFLCKMTALRDKCRSLEQMERDRVVIVADRPWKTVAPPRLVQQRTESSESEDDANMDSGALAPERRELHASRDISVCLLYRLALVTHSILQYLVFINVGGNVVRELADEVLVVAVRQQMTESMQEMYLDPNTRMVDALFDTVMTRAATLILRSGTTSKHLRVRTLQQCRLGSAVASWQLATLLLAGVGEAFSEAVVAEFGREDRTRKYCTDSLALIPRLKDDCLYRLFNALQLKHRKLGLLQAQHTDSLDPVVSRAVGLLTNIAVTYALHLFRTQAVQLRHIYLHRRELQEDFGRFLACLNVKFCVRAPQSATTMDVMAGGRLRVFMVEMLVHYYNEVVEASGDSRQAVLE
ncbi:unnamed protein product [Ixodes hexagonus]